VYTVIIDSGVGTKRADECIELKTINDENSTT